MTTTWFSYPITVFFTNKEMFKNTYKLITKKELNTENQQASQLSGMIVCIEKCIIILKIMK